MRLFLIFILLAPLSAALTQTLPLSEVIPLPDNQATFQYRGEEKTRWHFDPKYPRPFFYPFTGPSGASLTRMGHPGAPNHDHHLSVWFAHHKLNGHNFWGNSSGTQIRQKQWLTYHDSDTEAIMGSLLGWYSEDGVEQMEQELVAAMIPKTGGEYLLELQSTFRPPANAEKVELEQTNFGFFAVRVAKSISEHFGSGQLTNSEGQISEKEIFGKPARWMDYSGPVAVGKGDERKTVDEGITFFDHPENPRYPTHWHVRQDGWMGASFGMNEAYTITKDEPLVLRYLLYSHSGLYDANKAGKIAKEFGQRGGFKLITKPKSHIHIGIERRDTEK